MLVLEIKTRKCSSDSCITTNIPDSEQDWLTICHHNNFQGLSCVQLHFEGLVFRSEIQENTITDSCSLKHSSVINFWVLFVISNNFLTPPVLLIHAERQIQNWAREQSHQGHAPLKVNGFKKKNWTFYLPWCLQININFQENRELLQYSGLWQGFYISVVRLFLVLHMLRFATRTRDSRVA